MTRSVETEYQIVKHALATFYYFFSFFWPVGWGWWGWVIMNLSAGTRVGVVGMGGEGDIPFCTGRVSCVFASDV